MVISERDTSGLTKSLTSLRRRASKLLRHVILRKSSLPQAPFPALLRSNIQPTESEASLVRDVIIAAELEESRMKDMVFHHTANVSDSDRLTSKTLRNLNREIDRTQRFIVEHKAILSIIRRIPPEIFQIIFIHTLPTAVIPFIPFSPSQLPWALSQVCQLWRITMLSFSFMWKNLPVVRLNKAYTKETPYLDFLTEMLKRSHSTPIHLSIVSPWDHQVAHPALDMLVLHSDRWQEIVINSKLIFMPTFQKIKGRLASLQSLYVNMYTTHTTDTTAYDLFRDAPQLRQLHTMGPAGQFIFPTHQLVEYCQTGGSINQVIQIVVSSPSLKVLRFDGDEEAEGVVLSITPQECPHLTILTLESALSYPFFELLFNNVMFPAIEELYLDIEEENVIRPVRSMILRSGSPSLLRILHLQHKITPGDLSSLLTLTPLLTSLKITLPPADDISALIFDGNTPPLVPLLEECEFLDRYNRGAPPTETIEALKLFASSRCELPNDATSQETLPSGKFHRLQTFCICFGRWSELLRRDFEGWVYTEMADDLCKQRKRLLTMLLELIHSGVSFVKWRNELELVGMLTHLENLNIEKASDICMSSIHYVIYVMSVWFKNRNAKLNQIAERTLKKWEPILRGNMQSIRWISTNNSLKYISTAQNHALCSSPDSMKVFFYGLNLPTSDSDADTLCASFTLRFLYSQSDDSQLY